MKFSILIEQDTGKELIDNQYVSIRWEKLLEIIDFFFRLLLPFPILKVRFFRTLCKIRSANSNCLLIKRIFYSFLRIHKYLYIFLYIDYYI